MTKVEWDDSLIPHSSFPTHMRRSTQAELLDAPAQDEQMLRGNLRDMARYDRRLGTFELSLRLATESLNNAVTALDVGVGNGAFIHFAAARSPLIWVGIDISPAIIRMASESCTAPLVAACGQRLPFPDRCFDVVTCANTLHHLDEGDAVMLLRECARIARQRMVVVDLARSRLAVSSAWLLTRLTSRNRMTLADGVQSARRAYTPEEATKLAAQAGLPGAQVCRRRLFHYSLVVPLHPTD